LPAASCDRNRTSVAPSSETAADAAGASPDQLEPPSVEVSTVSGSAARPEPPASDSGPTVMSTDATFCLHLHPHPIFRPTEQTRDFGVHERRRLVRGVDDQRIVGGLCHRDERLKRHVQALLALERVLEHVGGAFECAIRIAAPQVIIERHVGAGAALQVLEIGKSAGRLEHVVDDDVGLHRRDLVVYRRQFVVFGRDQLHRVLGDMRIGGEHHRDRLADVVHLVERQDRLIVEGGTVIGLGNDLVDVFAGDDAVHAVERTRRRGVDAADAAVRHGRAEHLAVQHAGQAQVMRIFGAAGDLGARFEPRQLSADFTHGRAYSAPPSNA